MDIRPHKKRAFAPLLLAIVIGSFILFLAWAANRASVRGTDVTDAEYYAKGLKYNTTMVEKRAASVIGWRLQTHVDRHRLTFLLVDGDERPITAATGRLYLPVEGSSVLKPVPLTESEPGIYSTELPERLPNNRAARVEFERNGARIYRQLLLNVPAGGNR